MYRKIFMGTNYKVIFKNALIIFNSGLLNRGVDIELDVSSTIPEDIIKSGDAARFKVLS